jgi:C-terminal processing protease CtpA/Prc
MNRWSSWTWALLLWLPSCTLFGGGLPAEPPPLLNMDVALDRLAEPQDEAERQQLELGGFSGIYVNETVDSLDELDSASLGLTVARVVENSPADHAGIVSGDLLLEVRGPTVPQPRLLRWASDWREIELIVPPGTPLELRFDRAGREATATVALEPRLHPVARHRVDHYREEQQVGVVLRTPTEVEAHRAGLPPGAGAVVVGLSRRSPWRAAGLLFGDLLVNVNGQRVGHPQAVLDAIRNAEPGSRLQLDFLREGTSQSVAAAISAREQEISAVTLPLVFRYESGRGRSEWSLLLGLVSYESTAAAWEFGFLWLFSVRGGDADRLQEIGR